MLFKKKKLFNINTINIKIRKTLIKSMVQVWSTKLKANRRKIEAYEAWCY